MTHVIKEKDAFLLFDSFVRNMDIVYTIEPVASIDTATTFSSAEVAKEFIGDLNKQGYDTDNMEVKCIATLREEAKIAKENATTEMYKNAWSNTSEEQKKEILAEKLKEGGTKAVTEWLERVGDTSGITPAIATPKFCSECGQPYGTCAHTSGVTISHGGGMTSISGTASQVASQLFGTGGIITQHEQNMQSLYDAFEKVLKRSLTDDEKDMIAHEEIDDMPSDLQAVYAAMFSMDEEE